MPGIIVASGSNLSPIYVMEKVIAHYAEVDNWYSKFTGESGMSVIQKITKLEKSAGDTIRVTIFDSLLGEGKDGDAVLEDGEEAMVPRQDTLIIDQKRHATRVNGKMTSQRSAIDLHAEAAFQIGAWSKNWMGRLISIYLAGRRGTRTMPIIPVTFSSFAGNTLDTSDAGHTLWAGSAGTEAGLVATDVMSTALIDLMDRKINLLINSGYPMAFPSQGGDEVRALKITAEQWYDLQQDSDWFDAQKQAADRGGKNPLFTGSKGKWKGYEIFVDPAGVIFDTSGSVSAASAQVLGCQAGLLAFGGVEDATDGGGGKWAAVKEKFDYGNQTGFAVSTILGFKKTRINSTDHGVFTLNTGYTP